MADAVLSHNHVTDTVAIGALVAGARMADTTVASADTLSVDGPPLRDGPGGIRSKTIAASQGRIRARMSIPNPYLSVTRFNIRVPATTPAK